MMPLSKKYRRITGSCQHRYFWAKIGAEVFFTGDSADNPPSNRLDHLCACRHLSHGLSLP
jgi:hypothetical protein